MMAILKSLHKIEERFDKRAEAFVFHHPLAAFLLMFLVMPVGILLIVSLGTMAIAFPFSCLFGWG